MTADVLSSRVSTAALGEPFLARFSAFIMTLRANGFSVGLAECRDALRIVTAIDLANRNLFFAALRVLFTCCREDWVKFEQVFNAFWFTQGTKSATLLEDRRQSSPSRHATNEDGAHSGTGAPSEEQGGSGLGEGKDQKGIATFHEALGRQDFRHILNREELQRAYMLAERLAIRMRIRLTRRDRAAKRGYRLDFRRTFHRSIPRGGTPIDLFFRHRKPKPLRIVMLLDTSGSMAAYIPVFVRFMHGMLGSFRYASTFLFHTRLVDVTSAMMEKDPQRAIDRFSLMTEGVGGGTKIGASLATFNARYAAQIVRSRTAVMIISDGYETGDPACLANEMQVLHRRCRRIVWLNPMAGWQGYAPEAEGMKAALPFIDLFAPAHNLKSLEALEPYLARL